MAAFAVLMRREIKACSEIASALKYIAEISGGNAGAAHEALTVSS